MAEVLSQDKAPKPNTARQTSADKWLCRGMPDLEDRLRGQFASFFTLSRKDNITTEQLQLRLLEGRRDRLLHEEEHEDGTRGTDFEQSDLDSEDDELGQAYDSPFDTTYLEFSHASVRDFLLKEGTPETQKWPTDLGVGVEVNNAQLHITTVLLNVLCDSAYDDTYPHNNISSYAADFSLAHLLVSHLDCFVYQDSCRDGLISTGRISHFHDMFT